MSKRHATNESTAPWSALGSWLGHTASEAAPAVDARPIRCEDAVYELLRPDLAGLEQEAFVAVLLDSKHRPVKRVLVALGSLASVDVHPREVFREAIRAGAANVIVAHNHPSGDPEPSGEDLALTRRLRDAGDLLGIKVLDHIIIGKDRYVSLAGRGEL